MDLTKLSTEDLLALKSGDLAKVSTAGLQALKGVNENVQAGKAAPGWQQGLASVANGPLMGFADEVGGVVGGLVDKLQGKPGTFSEQYTANRDHLRGMQQRQQEENPWTTGLTQAAASGPTMVLAPLRALGMAANAIKTTGVIGNTARAATTGATFGAVGGAGHSTADTAGGVAADAGKGAAFGAAASGVLTPAAAAMGSMGQNAWTRLNDTAAGAYAREKVAQALARDARGNVFTSGQGNPLTQILARHDKLGPEAAIVDSAGKNTTQLLDTLATLPGRTKDAAAQFQRQRTASAGPRLRAAADDALDTGGQRLAPTLEALDDARRTAAAPLYDQLRGVAVTVDDDIANLIVRTRGHHSEAQNLYRLTTGQEINLGAVQKGQSIPFQMLDHLKQSLDDAASAAKQSGNRKMGLAVDEARLALIAKLDDVAPKVDGNSVYKAARDAYAGPSQLMDAAQAGRKAIVQDEMAITDAVRNLTTSEREAFRIGAFEGLRAKLGTQSGQTNILNMWKEPTTREKLKVIFGDERAFREFAAAAGREGVLKRVQSVGNGSQTAARQAGMGDIDAAALAGDAGQAIAAAKTGNVLSAVGAARNVWNRVATPEPVRNRMGEILMQRGPEAQQTLNSLATIIQQINAQNATRADLTGVVGSQIGNRLAVPLSY